MNIHELAHNMLDKIATDLAARTQDYYYSKLAQVEKWGGWPDDVTKVTQKHVDDYVKHRRKQGAGPTIGRELAALQRAYRLSRIRPQWEVYKEDIPRKKHAVSVPTDEEVRTIWGLMDEGLRLGACLALFAGLRAEEIPRVQWGMVDFNTRLLHIPGDIRKTGEPNVIPVCDTLWAAMMNVGIGEGTMLPMTNSDVTNAFKRITYKQPIHWGGFQRFRRLLVTWAEDDGHDIEQIALVTGHRRRSMTSRYTETAGKLKHKLAVITSVEDRFRKVVGDEG